jgi:hypothetical protein
MSDLAATPSSRLTPIRLMLGVTLLTGVLGWVCIAVAGHRLGPAGYARFSVVWGVLFGLGGAFSGLQQEVTRSTYRARPGDAPIWRRASVVAASFCLLSGLVIVVVRPVELGGTPGQVLLVVGALAGFAGLTFVNGVLSQREQWPWVAAVLALEALSRTAAVVLVLGRSRADNVWLVAVIGVGSLAWAILLGSGAVRGALNARGADPSGFTWRAWSAILSAGCTSALVAGFPFLLAMVYSGRLDATAGTLLAGLVLVRSPLLLVVFGLRPVLMRAFLGSDRAVRDVLRLWAWCLVIASLGCLAAVAVGGHLLAAVMGEGFRLPGWQLAVLLAGSAGLAMLTLSGLALIASDAHLWSTLGWLGTLAATLVLLALPGSAEQRILTGLPLAPPVGLLVHVAGLRRTSVRRRPG